MIVVDLHSHSHFSNCGIHSHLELLRTARDKGMQGLAITDHGPSLHGRDCTVVYDRLRDPVEGIRFLKGMECNLAAERGTIDVPRHLVHWLDVLLLGIHHNTDRGLGVAGYTDLLIAAIENNPQIDIITHPNDMTFRVDFNRVAEAAREHGLALELNNSKTMLQRVPDEVTIELIEACAKQQCPMVVCSDAHAINELGRDEDVRPLLEKVGFPSELLINNTAERAYEFIEGRRKNKAS